MNGQEFNALKAKIQHKGLKDGATIVNEGGPVFDPNKSDWDAEGLNFILGRKRGELTDSQYKTLLTTYGKALTKGGRNAS